MSTALPGAGTNIVRVIPLQSWITDMVLLKMFILHYSMFNSVCCCMSSLAVLAYILFLQYQSK